MRNTAYILTAGVLLAACSDMTAYEKSVEDLEPVYCYKSLGGVECFAKPNHRDERRLVNFYGAAPRTYEAPAAVKVAEPKAPPKVNYFVRDPEPVPRTMAKGDLQNRPWLLKNDDGVTVHNTPDGIVVKHAEMPSEGVSDTPVETPPESP